MSRIQESGPTHSELLPSLRIQRHISSGLSQESIEALGAALTSPTMPRGVSMQLSPDSPIMLLHTTETLAHYHVAGQTPDEAEVEKLGEYLEDNLPADFNDPIQVHLLPLAEYHWISSKGRGRPREVARCAFFAAAKDSTLLEERGVIKTALADYFMYTKAQKQEVAAELQNRAFGIRIAVTAKPPQIKAVRHALAQNVNLLPEVVTLDGIVIENS